jgi:hypothetical protein
VPETAVRGRIFISYRREETAYPTGWLYDRLVDHYGDGQVFKDVDSIDPGEDFVAVLENAVGSCDVLLAVMGTHWLTVTDEDGKRRLDDPADFVRLEIEAALSRNVLVVPVLVDGARMPAADDLPASLAPLVRRNALELSPNRFEFETSRLLRVLDETLGEKRKPTATPARPPIWKRVRRTQLTALGIGVALVAVLALALAYVTSGGESSAAGAIFRDDFSTVANGWDDRGNEQNGGHYVNGAYRLYTQWAPDHFSDAGLPRGAKSVFPKAPTDITVSVVAQRLVGADQDAGYGIMCRASPNTASYYQFAIWRDHAEIAKVIPVEPFFEQLAASEDLSAVHANGKNRLQAVCADDGGSARLAFSVNGKEVATATDATQPLSSGTVGLVVATGGKNVKAIEAEFDDFVVTSG